MAEPVDFDPQNNPIHAVRLEYGDFDEDTYILSDQSYQFYINKYPDSLATASKYIGLAILATFAREGYRQRVGQEEAYLGDRYTNYLDWLKKKATNPQLSGRVPAVYVGGVFREVVEYYNQNPDLVSSSFFRGQHQDRSTKLLNEEDRFFRSRKIIK